MLLVLIACQKETKHVEPKPQGKELNVDYFNVHKDLLRAYKHKLKLRKPPKVTPNQNVIFLDFDGHNINSTSWNSNSDFYAEPANMSDVEQQLIVDSIKSKYDTFNVVVTRDSAIYAVANPYKRIRAILTTTWQWYGSVGGVSYTGSFTWGDDTGCFIFVSLLGYNMHHIIYATSHEIGHSLGLRHIAKWSTDCILLDEYNKFPENNGFGYIMGLPNSFNLVAKFGIGHTPYDCVALQNDWQIISSITGFK